MFPALGEATDWGQCARSSTTPHPGLGAAVQAPFSAAISFKYLRQTTWMACRHHGSCIRGKRKRGPTFETKELPGSTTETRPESPANLTFAAASAVFLQAVQYNRWLPHCCMMLYDAVCNLLLLSEEIIRNGTLGPSRVGQCQPVTANCSEKRVWGTDEPLTFGYFCHSAKMWRRNEALSSLWKHVEILCDSVVTMLYHI